MVEWPYENRLEVFELFRSMSQELEEPHPLSFELVKTFMGNVTALVLDKLKATLTSLKANALNPVSIRIRQVRACVFVGKMRAERGRK